MTRPELPAWGPLVVPVGKKEKPPLPFLKRLFTEETLVVGPTDGEPITQAIDVFGYINCNFKCWRLDVKSPPTKETTLHIFQMIRDGKLHDILESLGEGKLIFWEESQVVQFCKEHRNRLRPRGGVTFFPITKAFVIGVTIMFNDELGANIYRDDRDSPVWHAEHQDRLVIPLL